MAYRAGRIIHLILGALLVLSAVGKLLAPAPVTEAFAAWGLAGSMLPVALFELAGAALLVLPRTQLLGTLALSAFFGGAAATHLIAGEARAMLVPVAVLGLLWLALLLIYPKNFFAPNRWI